MEQSSRSKKELNARFEEESCYIAGLAVVSRHLLALTDHHNRSVKLIDVNTNKIKAYLQLSADLRGITVMSETEVAVIVPAKRWIQKIGIHNENDVYTMNRGDKITTNGECAGIDFNATRNFFAVSFTHQPKVEIIDVLGNILYSTENPIGDIKFKRPLYVRSSVTGDEVYVTDQESKEIICLQTCTDSNQLSERFRKTISKLNIPRDICVLNDKSLLICGKYSNNVCKLSQFGDNCEEILTEKDGLEDPCAITFMPENSESMSGTLFVSCNRIDAPPILSNNIKVFSLSTL